MFDRRFACLLLFALTASPLFAADDKKLTITDPAKVDRDYAFQGEYSSGGWGLQVVAMGDAKFEASLYGGGLPGEGGTKASREKFVGKLENDVLTLRGGLQTVVVFENYAELYDLNGCRIAVLSERQRVSPTMHLPAPANAIVLFDGTSVDHFKNGKTTPDKLLLAGAGTKQDVGDFRLHLEFRTPYKPHARGQGRGNSGVYIQTRYEVQVLDSFGLEGVENECGGLYRQKAPDVNMALPPLVWQTYDIWFRAARFSADGKTKLESARITVLHNGVAVHDDYVITAKTGGGKQEGPSRLPIQLQDHGNPVVFRNIWLVEGEGTPPSKACCVASTPRRGLFSRLRR